jgi:hypothetical protein
MHGSSGSRGVLVHLMAGAALGAVVVLVAWIFSGGRPFGEVVGTSDVSSPTTAAVKQTDVRSRAAAPAGTDARLESELPALAARKAKAAKGSGSIQFRKPVAKRPSKAVRDAAATRRSRAKARSRKRQVVRVVAPPADEQAGGEDTPVAAVPSPAPSAAPTPAAKPAPAGGGGKPAKPRQPTYVAGAGEG